jgi:hypothetical protein
MSEKWMEEAHESYLEMHEDELREEFTAWLKEETKAV